MVILSGLDLLLKRPFGAILLCLTLQGLGSPALAYLREDMDKPLYEVGIMGGLFDTPDYPGAEQGRIRTLGVPYFIYRGKVLRADQEDGVRGRFFNSDRLEFDVSMGAGFPSKSKDNRAREGMPSLDWTGEVGPSLVYHAVKDSAIVALDLNFPLRWVFSTDFTRVDDRGFVFQPGFDFTHESLFDENVKFFTRWSLIYATRPLMQYYYEVPLEYATASRPAYEARPGLLGSKVSVAVTNRFTDRVLFFTAFVKSFYHGVANSSSPLLKTTHTSSLVVGVIWNFYHSEETAGQWY